MTYLNSIKQEVDNLVDVSSITSLRTGFKDQPSDDKYEILFVDATQLFTIQPKAPVTEFDIYYQNEKITISSAKTITISVADGLHYIYYDTTTGFLGEVLTFEPGLILGTSNRILLGIVYWDNTNTYAPLVACEAHTAARNLIWHLFTHTTFGARYDSGGAVSGYVLNGVLNTDITFQIEDTKFYDEDLLFEIVNGTPSNDFSQDLRLDRSGAGLDTLAQIPPIHRIGAGGTWQEDAAGDYAWKQFSGGSNRLAVNQFSGGVWTQIEVPDKDFCSALLIATNDTRYPIKMVQGQEIYASKKDALAGYADEITAFGQFPSAEVAILYRFLLETRTTYGNARKCRIVAVQDYRGSQIPAGTSSVLTDHAGLSSLDYDASGHTDFQRVYYPLNTGGMPSGDYDSVDTVGVGISFKQSDQIKDTSTGYVWVCTDATPTAAVWVNTTESGGSSPYTELSDGDNLGTSLLAGNNIIRIAADSTVTINAATDLTGMGVPPTTVEITGTDKNSSKIYIDCAAGGLLTLTDDVIFENLTLEVNAGATLTANIYAIAIGDNFTIQNCIITFTAPYPTSGDYLCVVFYALTKDQTIIRDIDVIFSTHTNVTRLGLFRTGNATTNYDLFIENINIVSVNGNALTWVRTDQMFIFIERQVERYVFKNIHCNVRMIHSAWAASRIGAITVNSSAISIGLASNTIEGVSNIDLVVYSTGGTVDNISFCDFYIADKITDPKTLVIGNLNIYNFKMSSLTGCSVANLVIMTSVDFGTSVTIGNLTYLPNTGTLTLPVYMRITNLITQANISIGANCIISNLDAKAYIGNHNISVTGDNVQLGTVYCTGTFTTVGASYGRVTNLKCNGAVTISTAYWQIDNLETTVGTAHLTVSGAGCVINNIRVAGNIIVSGANPQLGTVYCAGDFTSTSSSNGKITNMRCVGNMTISTNGWQIGVLSVEGATSTFTVSGSNCYSDNVTVVFNSIITGDSNIFGVFKSNNLSLGTTVLSADNNIFGLIILTNALTIVYGQNIKIMGGNIAGIISIGDVGAGGSSNYNIFNSVSLTSAGSYLLITLGDYNNFCNGSILGNNAGTHSVVITSGDKNSICNCHLLEDVSGGTNTQDVNNIDV